MTDEGNEALLKHLALMPMLRDPKAKIGVAVSGGSDSMAALYLMVNTAPGQVAAVTVDHRLRTTSGDEARQVAQVCANLGVAHTTLEWDHSIITGNLQDQARRARYRLIGDWARGQGVEDVVLGHTADDQAETFLMGLAREAGLDGLSGMRREWVQGGVRFVRPFLTVLRADLRAYLRRRDVSWIDDPSNENADFTRVKARRVMQALEPLGISAAMLAGSAGHLAQAGQALDEVMWQAFQDFGEERAGGIAFARREFMRLPGEVSRRLVDRALRWVSSADHGPRGPSLMRAAAAMMEGRDLTLHGCRVRIGEDIIRITREPKAVAGVTSPTGDVWDGRWQMEGPHAPGLEVRALGAEGLRACKDWRATGLSRDVLIVTPAIWRGDTLIAAPSAGKSAGWAATVTAAFGLFAVSH